MKNNYLKSIGLILFLGMLSLFIYSFSPDDSLESNTCETPKLISIERAEQEVAAYQMWLHFLPDSFQIDETNRKIRYVDKTIDKDTWDLVMPYFRMYYGYDLSGSKPFVPGLYKSFYISRDKINKALDSTNNANGINVYMAVRNFQEENKRNKIEAHVVILPSKKECECIDGKEVNCTLTDRLIEKEGVKCALDLTDPCPKLCDESSRLFNPKLKPLHRK
ncbi:hypothetical protein [uncultured Kordia sp.]|uniref:hypothetical protein n=1 Tax=uncultured Kordia sp. TaxID=507699 RepID=UPI0026114E6E|nr:hypothetical protein [uncultured Kordia sp.]